MSIQCGHLYFRYRYLSRTILKWSVRIILFLLYNVFDISSTSSSLPDTFPQLCSLLLCRRMMFIRFSSLKNSSITVRFDFFIFNFITIRFWCHKKHRYISMVAEKILYFESSSNSIITMTRSSFSSTFSTDAKPFLRKFCYNDSSSS